MTRVTRSRTAAFNAPAIPAQQKLELRLSKAPQHLSSPPPTSGNSYRKRKAPVAIDNGSPHSLGLVLLPTPGPDEDFESPSTNKRAKETKLMSDDADDENQRTLQKQSTKSKKATYAARSHKAKPANSTVQEPMTVEAPLTAEERAKVVKSYGLKPGVSPYPDYSKPSHDEAYEVVRLLEQHHGVERVMPPRAADVDRTGCGDVPNILDALLRTYISTQCNVDASNAALQSLGQVYGVKNGSPDWYAVLHGAPEQLRDALTKCGMQTMKARNILRTLRMVWDDEQERRLVLGSEGRVDKGTKDATKVKQYDNIMIGFLDYIHDVQDSYQAMERMLQFPGIGIKVSACVALFSMGRPVFAVDTHVERLCKYLGWVPDDQNAKPKLTAERVFAHCDVRLPDDTKYKLHQLFWKHGRECFKCKEKTTPARAEWAKVTCPIENLVNRASVDPRKDECLARKVVKEKKVMGVNEQDVGQAAIEVLEAKARDASGPDGDVLDEL